MDEEVTLLTAVTFHSAQQRLLPAL